MAWFDTSRSPRVLLRQRDLHIVLAVVVADLALTVTGLQHGGVEGNPLYAPLTGSTAGIGGGILLYFLILGAASTVIGGVLRRVLASVVFGMHVVGTATWMVFFVPSLFSWMHIWWLSLFGTAGTALFYAGYDRGLY